MENSRSTDEQFNGLVKRVEGRVPVKDISRKQGCSDAMYYKWRSRLGRSYASEIRHLREFDSESAKSTRMPAEAVQAQTGFSER